MNRLGFVVSVVAILGIAAWAYGVNYRTAETLREVDRLRAAIAQAREDVQVLEVEWAYLNRPERLAALVAGHGDALGLVPLTPEQFGDVAAIPFPPQANDDPVTMALAAASRSILAQHGGEGPAAAPAPELLPMLPAESVAGEARIAAGVARRATASLPWHRGSVGTGAGVGDDASDTTVGLAGSVVLETLVLDAVADVATATADPEPGIDAVGGAAGMPAAGAGA
ncbi:MAG: hypothetical protein AAFR52_08705, partial [Pseudomonadota bacterium]